MNFTPNDLHNIEFKKSVIGGYNQESVRETLDKIIEDYTAYVKENIELKDKLAMLNEGIQHYKNIEESLQNTLMMAQKTGDEIKKNARDKAENIIKDAEHRAQKCVEEASQEVVKINFEYEEIKKRVHLFKTKSETLLNSQLEMLKEVMEEAEKR